MQSKGALLFLVFLAIFSSFEAKKAQKVHKVIYVEKAPVAPKQVSQYELCKRECRIQRDAQSNQERVEQLKRELEEAETLLAEHNEHVDAPKIPVPEEERVASGNHPSRYDHLKMAASKIVESGSELKNAISGGNRV